MGARFRGTKEENQHGAGLTHVPAHSAAENRSAGVIREQGDEWVEALGYCGMDFACIDFMITSIDWSHAAHMVRTCNQHEMTPWVRLQSFSWGRSAHSTGGQTDQRVIDRAVDLDPYS